MNAAPNRDSIVDAAGRSIPLVRVPPKKPRTEPAVYVRETPVWKRLEQLTGRIRRLSFSSRDPERFHLDRDEICRELMGISHAQRPPGSR